MMIMQVMLVEWVFVLIMVMEVVGVCRVWERGTGRDYRSTLCRKETKSVREACYRERRSMECVLCVQHTRKA